jgi:ribosomal protein S18 acetylase RimI-like enzyme
MIRPYHPDDRDALYRVCLRTGDSGADATGRYRDPRILGDVFVGPYLELHPELAFVLDGGAGAEGYVLGALDSIAFAAECERTWWPPLREHYRDAPLVDGIMDGFPLSWIRQPPPVPAAAGEFPSHLHIDLLPHWQSGGWGRRLIDRLCAALATAGSPGVHLIVGLSNEHAIGFYRHVGFIEVERRTHDLILGRVLAP